MCFLQNLQHIYRLTNTEDTRTYPVIYQAWKCNFEKIVITYLDIFNVPWNSISEQSTNFVLPIHLSVCVRYNSLYYQIDVSETLYNTSMLNFVTPDFGLERTILRAILLTGLYVLPCTAF